MKNRTFRAGKLLVIVFLLISVVFPLASLVLNIQMEDVSKVISAPQFIPMLFNSLLATSIATALSVVIAFGLAWCVNRTNIRYKQVFSILFTIPMLIPSISHGMGLVLLFGDNGLITNFLHINIGLYGYLGIIIGSILYSFPVAFLMLTDIFKYEDYTTYEAAQVLGLSKKQQFFTITLPNMKGTLISVIFATFTMIFTDYGVPLVVGGKIMTLPVYMYREVIGLLDFSKGAIIGVILLIPAFIAFFMDLKNESSGNSSTITRSFQIQKNKKRDIISYFICILSFLANSGICHFIFCKAISDRHELFTCQYKGSLPTRCGYVLEKLFSYCASNVFGRDLRYLFYCLYHCSSEAQLYECSPASDCNGIFGNTGSGAWFMLCYLF